MTEYSDVKHTIVKILSKQGPMGWYRLEILLNIPRSEFKYGYTLMTYLDELEAEEKIRTTKDGKYYVES